MGERLSPGRRGSSDVVVWALARRVFVVGVSLWPWAFRACRWGASRAAQGGRGPWRIGRSQQDVRRPQESVLERAVAIDCPYVMGDATPASRPALNRVRRLQTGFRPPLLVGESRSWVACPEVPALFRPNQDGGPTDVSRGTSSACPGHAARARTSSRHDRRSAARSSGTSA